ncbi:energy transducer TonB [Winogradskyella sp.]|uniref:energy transducer TonB n=1 Tax=Winogradskyella sp. TaxID=1883156 RepID=UPI003F6CA2F2
MKNSKKDFSIAGQSTTEVKKSQKHDANLQKNSTLYFQIGLILCLLGTYALFEMQFQNKKVTLSDDKAKTEIISVDYVKPFIVEVIEPEQPKPQIERAKEIIEKFEEVDNEKNVIETQLVSTDDKKDQYKPASVGEIIDIKEPIEPVKPIPFKLIEKVPVYPGCEKYTSNKKRKKCMSSKLTKLINRRFNTGIAGDYGITGVQRISTVFTIDKNGNVTDVLIRAPHPALEKEAERLIRKIPQMEPGLQRNIPVGVVYTLPIVFDARY